MNAKISTGYLNARDRYVLIEVPTGRISVAHSLLRRPGSNLSVMHLAIVTPMEQGIHFIHGGGA